MALSALIAFRSSSCLYMSASTIGTFGLLHLIIQLSDGILFARFLDDFIYEVIFDSIPHTLTG